jgi:putative transposase
MESRKYPTDLSDHEWRCIRPHLPEPTGQVRPRPHGLRAILDAVFYVLKSGCPWRLLPREFPPWKTVYDWFRRWRIDGTWERLNAELRERLRCRLGRDPNPSAGIVDSQSASTTGVGGNERGFDPAKKVEGRKRRLLVDTEGLVLSKPKYTAPKCQTKMASGCCWSRRASALGAFRTCGSMPDTKGGAGGGPRRSWV